MDREAWRAAVHGVAKNRTRLNDWAELSLQSSVLILCFTDTGVLRLIRQYSKRDSCSHTQIETVPTSGNRLILPWAAHIRDLGMIFDPLFSSPHGTQSTSTSSYSISNHTQTILPLSLSCPFQTAQPKLWCGLPAPPPWPLLSRASPQ